jgi:hypothetical protein
VIVVLVIVVLVRVVLVCWWWWWWFGRVLRGCRGVAGEDLFVFGCGWLAAFWRTDVKLCAGTRCCLSMNSEALVQELFNYPV